MSAPGSSPAAFKPHLQHLLSLLFLVLVPLAVVGFIAEDIFEKERFAFENPLMEAIHAHSSAGVVNFSVLLHHIGGPLVMGVVFVLIPVVLWLTRRRHLALFTFYGLGGTVVLNAAMKLLFARPRPELWARVVTENVASFPSGHSMFAAALSTVLVLLAWRTSWRMPVLVLGVIYTLLMAFSRLVLGVHYPTDVLCGALAGMAWVYGVYRLMGGRSPHAPLDPTVPDTASADYAVAHEPH